MVVNFSGTIGGRFPVNSIFKTISNASEFYRIGTIGYSMSLDQSRMDGLELNTKSWTVDSIESNRYDSSYFQSKLFPSGSVIYDNTLIMRDIKHEWISHQPIMSS